MRIAYDAGVDILTIDFESKAIKVSEEVLPGVIADFDHDGRLVGFEIMDAGKVSDFSQVEVFVSQWGSENRILDASGGLTFSPGDRKS